MKEDSQCAKSLVGRWFQHLQNDYVLPVARILYLVGAAGSLLVVVGGLLFVLFLQTQIGQSPMQEPVPDIKMPGHRQLDLTSVGARLAPPTNITLHTQQITGPLKNGTIVGYFSADTVNDLAAYPGDTSILDGEDAALFKQIGFRLDKDGEQRTALIPSSELINKINDQLKTLPSPFSQEYHLRVTARDIYDNVSVPENVTFTLTFGSMPPTKTEPELKLTDYQRVARDIALIVDPSRTPAYFKAYKRALRVPGDCGTTDNDTNFASDARNAFNGVKSKLTAANVKVFYTALCSAWRAARIDEKTARARVEEVRRVVIARNAEARAQAEVATAGARLGLSVTLAVVGSALVAFLVISMLLAFLAIENHSKAMQEAVAAIAMKKNAAGNSDTTEASV